MDNLEEIMDNLEEIMDNLEEKMDNLEEKRQFGGKKTIWRKFNIKLYTTRMKNNILNIYLKYYLHTLL